MQESISNTYHHGRITGVLQLSMLVLTIALFTSCIQEEIATRDYPRLNTFEITDIGKNTVVVNAEILSGNPADITEYGFVWSPFEEFSIDDKQFRVGTPGAMKFGDTIQAYFQNNTIYNVRSYVRTRNLVVYGNTVTFLTPGSNVPIQTGFSPQSATWGDTVRITGMNFGYLKEAVEVTLENYIRAEVLSVTDEIIEIAIPEQRNREKIKITVSINGKMSVSATSFTYLTPVVTSVTPLSATYNDTIFIHGENFSRDQSIHQVSLNGFLIRTVYTSANLLKFIVPVTLNSESFRTNVWGPVFNTHTQDVTISLKDIELYSFDPDTVYADNEIITIRGNNFHPMLNYNRVNIYSSIAEIVELSATTIKVKLPPGIIPTNEETISTLIRVNSGPKAAVFNQPLVLKRK